MTFHLLVDTFRAQVLRLQMNKHVTRIAPCGHHQLQQ